jgi:hypothetical protein
MKEIRSICQALKEFEERRTVEIKSQRTKLEHRIGIVVENYMSDVSKEVYYTKDSYDRRSKNPVLIIDVTDIDYESVKQIKEEMYSNGVYAVVKEKTGKQIELRIYPNRKICTKGTKQLRAVS